LPNIKLMSRMEFFNYIEEKLSILATRIELRGRLNILDLHLHSENFYMYFFNMLFGWKLKNLNTISQNVAGIDLIDDDKKFIVQVSATATKNKIESALKRVPSKYNDYSFKFISISRGAKELQTKTYENPQNLKFSPAEDIYDICTLLTVISSMDIDRLKEVYNFLGKELGGDATGIIKPLTIDKRIIGVPSLPTKYLERLDCIEAIKTKLFSEEIGKIAITGKANKVGLQGMGGVGKSVIAAALAHDKEIRNHFPDGIVWLSIGREPNPVARQSELLRLFYEPNEIDKIRVENYKSELIEKFNDKKCLIILDDVWHSKDMIVSQRIILTEIEGFSPP